MDSNDNALLTPKEMAAADAAAIRGGIEGTALMEAAGKAVADAVRAHWPRMPVLVLCGPGNNGGDGFVAARHLAWAGWPVRLALSGGRRPSGDAAHHAALWTGPVEAWSPALLEGTGLVVDALFGAGLSRPIQGQARAMLEAVSHSGLPVCAVDMPSGLDGETGEVLGAAVPAALTVTFFRKKPGHCLMPGRRMCGEVIVADIGIPAEVLRQAPPHCHENAPRVWQAQYPWPGVQANKYHRGHVLVLGGEALTGAARLAATAAARVGAGLVTVAAPQKVWAVYAAALTSVMVQPLQGPDGLVQLLADARKNAIVAGPGAGVSDATRKNVLEVLATQRKTVLDADAITCFTRDPQLLFSAITGPCVLTPHEGEFSRIFPCEGSKLVRARYAARESGAVVLLKGADTVIAAPDGRAVINTNGVAELATAGTGDVLSGFIAGLMAQGMDAFFAAAAAAWLHGETARAFGPGLIAEDLVQTLPPVLRALKAGMQGSPAGPGA